MRELIFIFVGLIGPTFVSMTNAIDNKERKRKFDELDQRYDLTAESNIRTEEGRSIQETH